MTRRFPLIFPLVALCACAAPPTRQDAPTTATPRPDGESLAQTAAKREPKPEASAVAHPEEVAVGKEESASAPPHDRSAERQVGVREAAKLDDLLDNALTGPAKNSSVGTAPTGIVGVGRGGGGAGEGRIGLGTAGGHAHKTASIRARYGVPSPRALAMQAREFNTEAYEHREDNDFRQVADSPLSTFSIDVDTASYSNVRRFLRGGSRPPVDSVRIEELINYFGYDYEPPRNGLPFSVRTEVAAAPWNPRHRLVHIGLKGRDIEARDVPARNLVFLIDVSGSMQNGDKLPLLKRGMALLARQLRRQDRVAVVVYAGASGLVLDSTPGDRQTRILAALEQLEAGGSTNGAEGIELAYRVAQEHFVRGGINRVILATDGDFNVGVTSHGDLTRLIERKRKSGVFLTVLGFGSGNLKDATMETLADKGNGNYAYIDSIHEARKVLVREAGGTLVTIAKDVKLQIEFNPARVSGYRLIGYENRILAARDFNDDHKDAGEIGAGHTVTALYEVVLGDLETGSSEIDPLKYQGARALTRAADTAELLTVKLRYKEPEEDSSKLLSRVVHDGGESIRESSDDFRWSAAIAGFGMLLRNSSHRGDTSLQLVRQLAESAVGSDRHGDRRELLELIDRAEHLGIGHPSG